MKRILLAAAALAAAALSFAAPASAHAPGQPADWRRAEITLITDRGVRSFDRGDRAFYRLREAPYNFQPGFAYRYTERCNRRGCDVLVYRDGLRRPVNVIFAPHLPHPRALYGDIGWRDGRQDDRGRDDWRDDDRHGRASGHRYDR